VLETDGLRRSSRGIQSFLAFLLTLGGFSGSLLYGSSDSSYGQIPLTFIANRGQVHSSVRFTAQSPGLSAYFTPGEVVLDVGSAVIRMRYLGASISPAVEGLDLQEGKANYILGNDPKKWKTNVPLFGRLVYRDLYPGIDMLYLSSRRRLKSEFVVAPGADPSRIRIAYTGAGTIRVDETGGLIFNTPDGELREAAPEIYQELDGRREPVNGAFQVSGEVVSFLVGDYDRDRELRIDPVLSYSTYLGGSGTNKGTAIAVDSANAAYITGYTDSTNFPVTGGVLQPASGGNVDVFITKLNAAGSAIVYSTYLGGSGDDRGFSIAVDASGNAYVTGYTASTNFPLVAAVQTFFGGVRDAFVVKLNSTGSALLYSTYLGGSGTDSGNGIAIDAGGACYITGSTTSTDFPSVGAFQSANGGGSDAFVTKLNAAGSDYLQHLFRRVGRRPRLGNRGGFVRQPLYRREHQLHQFSDLLPVAGFERGRYGRIHREAELDRRVSAL
jgi:Beta-propeller repeat.